MDSAARLLFGIHVAVLSDENEVGFHMLFYVPFRAYLRPSNERSAQQIPAPCKAKRYRPRAALFAPNLWECRGVCLCII